MADAAAALVPGSSVRNLGGRDVHLHTRPGNGPAVVLLGGCGVPSYVWADVAALLGERSVVRLDRPGLLETRWPGTLPRLAEEVATLAALVDLLGEPVVVVAHSMAGPHAEALARTHPAAVAGLVLVDGSVEWRAGARTSVPAWLPVARGVRQVMRVPQLRFVGPVIDRILVSAQSRRRRIFDPVDELANATYRRGDTVASVIAEQAAYGQQLFDLEQVRRDHRWPGPPTVVLTAAGDGGSSWVQDQRRLAELLSGRHLVVADSRHLRLLDRPDQVADAVRSLVQGQDGEHA